MDNANLSFFRIQNLEHGMDSPHLVILLSCLVFRTRNPVLYRLVISISFIFYFSIGYSQQQVGNQSIELMLLVLFLRIHNSIKRSAYPSMPKSTFKFDGSDDQNRSRSSGLISTSEVVSSKLLHSWVHPQSTLPPSLIRVLTSSTAEGGELNNF